VYYVCELIGNYHVELLTSKTRIAPIKAQTIPRLELMSGLILARLMDTVRSALSVDVEIRNTYYWLDSKTALCWIQHCAGSITRESANSSSDIGLMKF
jgi:hypothetical protein